MLAMLRFFFHSLTPNRMLFNGDYLSASSLISVIASPNLTTSMSCHGPSTSLSLYPLLGLVTRTSDNFVLKLRSHKVAYISGLAVYSLLRVDFIVDVSMTQIRDLRDC